MEYKWVASDAQIQTFLQGTSIIIGDDVSSADAQTFENHGVDQIENYLAPGWTLPFTSVGADLQLLAAKFTVAIIATSQFGISQGKFMAELGDRYKTEVEAELRSKILNHPHITIIGQTKKALPHRARAIAAMTKLHFPVGVADILR